MCTEVSFVLSQFTHLTDGQTESRRQQDRAYAAHSRTVKTDKQKNPKKSQESMKSVRLGGGKSIWCTGRICETGKFVARNETMTERDKKLSYR